MRPRGKPVWYLVAPLTFPVIHNPLVAQIDSVPSKPEASELFDQGEVGSQGFSGSVVSLPFMMFSPPVILLHSFIPP